MARVAKPALVLSTFVDLAVVAGELGVASAHAVDTGTMGTAATAAITTGAAKTSSVTVEHRAWDGMGVKSRTGPSKCVLLVKQKNKGLP